MKIACIVVLSTLGLTLVTLSGFARDFVVLACGLAALALAMVLASPERSS